LQQLIAIASQFAAPETVSQVQPFGSGNINDTFLVSLDRPNTPPFILQRINTNVFQRPQLVMQNMRILTEHIRDRLPSLQLDRRWQTPCVLLTVDQQDCCTDDQGSVWRAISFIDGSQAFDTIQDLNHAQEIGYALGMFHSLISDLSPDRLADTLEGFHITPRYLEQYQQVLATYTATPTPEVKYGLNMVRDRQAWVPVLETAKAAGKLPLRLMHGDPKINNIMIDTVTQKSVSVIDLDTVKPGLVHYDIGDCLRSGCNPAGEETSNWQTVEFNPDLCRGVLQGYLSVAHCFMTAADYDYLFDAIRLISFELGLRFFTDYLAGNVYFKIKYPDHNLARALVQFKLTESIEAQETTLRKIIRDLH
jgi:Ser/Thr protein kinase RdoA (MazF antagonist)